MPDLSDRGVGRSARGLGAGHSARSAPRGLSAVRSARGLGAGRSTRGLGANLRVSLRCSRRKSLTLSARRMARLSASLARSVDIYLSLLFKGGQLHDVAAEPRVRPRSMHCHLRLFKDLLLTA